MCDCAIACVYSVHEVQVCLMCRALIRNYVLTLGMYVCVCVCVCVCACVYTLYI